MRFLEEDYVHCKYMLESFLTITNWFIPHIKNCEMFMLDSGAFVFMKNCKGEVNFDDYLTKYIEFINKHDIKYFFELDVDSVVGYEEVKRLRERLETETGKKSIPVWHRSRGKEDFIQMCQEYDYVAIGGIATKEIKPSEYQFLKWFIDTAHYYGCKIHGLGFTNVKGLYIYDFDSVDSTTWVGGGKFGRLYRFDGMYLKEVDTGTRRRRSDLNTQPINRHNYYEWIKFQKFADEFL
jgi:hypothetical protein